MIAVTGATGQLGHQVINHLLSRIPAEQIIAIDLESPRAAELTKLGVKVRFADYNDHESLLRAFAGADQVLLISSPSGPDGARVAQHQSAIDAAVSCGVSLFGYTSVTHAPTNTMGLAPVHRATEQAIIDAGLPAVILRNGWYVENHTAGIENAVNYGTLLGSAGDGVMASATRGDLAEAAAIIMTSKDQVGKIYDLTGDEAWSLADLAAEISVHAGKAITYTDLAPEAYRETLQQAGLPDHIVELIVDADVAIAGGTLDYVTNELSTLLGRPTTTMSAVVANMLKA